MRLIHPSLVLGAMLLGGASSTVAACGSDDDVGGGTETTRTPDAAVVQPRAPTPDSSAVSDGMPFEDGSARTRIPPGMLDPTFGIQGKVTIDFADYEDEAHAIARAADGTLVVAGSGGGFPSRFALAGCGSTARWTRRSATAAA